MKEKTIKGIVKEINKGLKRYQRELTYQLELKAECELHNGNLEVCNLAECDSKIKKLQVVIADLATIKRAVKNDKTEVEIFGTVGNRGCIYSETEDTLRKAGLDFDGDGYGTIWLFSLEEEDV